MLKRIDDAILAKVEKFCHWFQRLTGLTNFWLARVTFVIVMGTLSGVGVALIGPWAAFPVFLSALFTWGIWVSLVTIDEYYREGGATAHAWTLHWKSLGWLRLGAIVTTILVGCVAILNRGDQDFGVAFCLMAVVYACLSLMMYFLAIIPLPPGKSRIEQWGDDIRAGFQKQVRVPTR